MFKEVLVTIAFIACSKGYSVNQPPSLDGRIVGGSPIDISEAPYIVSIEVNQGCDMFLHYCGGSIISESIILTAAHCTEGVAVSDFRIRAGSANSASGGQLASVSQVIQHKNYSEWKYDNDVALLVLASPLTLDINVDIIELPVQDFPVLDGTDAEVSGWGLLENESRTTDLHRVVIPTVNQHSCSLAYETVRMEITGNMICAGRLGIGGQDACAGDSGGPLVINNTLIGITSWGRGCGLPKFPGVWTRVPRIRNWIDENSVINKQEVGFGGGHLIDCNNTFSEKNN